MTNKEIYLAYLDKYVKTRDLTKLKEFLETSDFFIAPASTRYHSNCVEGLAFHSICVLKRLFNLYKDYQLYKINEEIRKQAIAYKKECTSKGITPEKEFLPVTTIQLTPEENSISRRCETRILMENGLQYRSIQLMNRCH